MSLPLHAGAILLALATGAGSGEIRGTLHVTATSVASRARGPEEAIVYLEDAPDVGGLPPGPFQMVQLGKDFDPRVLVVPQGAVVQFPNNDPILHNVFSVTPGSSFDLGLHKPGETMSQRFDRPGVVSVYCNIHPQMVGYILVVTNRFFTHVKPDGSFSLDGVPPGRYRLAAWFPFGPIVRREVDVAPGAASAIDLRLQERPDASAHRRKDGSGYVGYGGSP